LLLLFRVHAPDDTSAIPGRAVNLVKDAP
jgi:hypothetical protein